MVRMTALLLELKTPERCHLMLVSSQPQWCCRICSLIAVAKLVFAYFRCSLFVLCLYFVFV